MKRYYLAYGSNLNVWQMALRCPTAKAVGTAVIKDYELLFKGSKTGSYLTIEPKRGAEVPVAVWAVEPKDEFSLDRYEGYPTFYYKTELELPVAFIKSGKTEVRTAFVYIMHENRPIGLPSGSYVRTCLEGYRYFGFDESILLRALDNSRRNRI
ncbi:MAG: gamma-glutamylcyclotransferase [Oscillospiraceae bacterium]|nr:gamma-glutamylcyclotransferase [Oscillospiraceae bacterium]MDY6207781.1 gamma-glutamylcyclotransferase family protein [Oscillospiraceae bacterium]